MLQRKIDDVFYFFKGPIKLLLRRVLDSKVKKVCIYGAGEIGTELFELLKNEPQIEVESIVDRKAGFMPITLEQFTVEIPDTIKALSDDVGIVIASEAFLDEIIDNIARLREHKPINIISLQ